MNRTKAIPATKKPTINYALSPFKVEKGREIPQPYQRGVFENAPHVKARHDNERPYPFHGMKVGESFLIPVPDRSTLYGVTSSVSATINSRMEWYGEQYTTRIVKNGVRVWRIA